MLAVDDRWRAKGSVSLQDLLRDVREAAIAPATITRIKI
jgi:hypothetical protein